MFIFMLLPQLQCHSDRLMIVCGILKLLLLKQQPRQPIQMETLRLSNAEEDRIEWSNSHFHIPGWINPNRKANRRTLVILLCDIEDKVQERKTPTELKAMLDRSLTHWKQKINNSIVTYCTVYLRSRLSIELNFVWISKCITISHA